MCHLCPSQPRNAFWGTTISAFVGVVIFQIYLILFYNLYFYQYYDNIEDFNSNEGIKDHDITSSGSFIFYPFDLSSRSSMDQVYNSTAYLNTVWIPASLAVAL